MATQRGSFDPYQGKHDPVLGRNLQAGESVTSCGFGALMLPMMKPMPGKVYVTTHRVAVVLDDGGRMWAVPWDVIASIGVKNRMMSATASIVTDDSTQFGVDSTKAIVRDLEAAWRIASAR